MLGVVVAKIGKFLKFSNANRQIKVLSSSLVEYYHPLFFNFQKTYEYISVPNLNRYMSGWPSG